MILPTPMKTHTILAFFLMLIFCPAILPAQDNDPEDNFLPGYIITLDNQKIDGYIRNVDHVFNVNNCVFRTSLNSGEQNYKPGEIKAYAIEGEKYFESGMVDIPPKSRMVFLESLVNGQKSLFLFRDMYYVNTDTGFAELINTQEIIYHNNRKLIKDNHEFKKLLRPLMLNCFTIDEILEKAELDQPSLVELFENYNICIGDQPEIYLPELEKLEFRFGAITGISISRLPAGYDFYRVDSCNHNLSFNLGVLAELSYPKFNKNITIRSGLIYTRSKYYCKIERNSIAIADKKEQRFKISSLLIPFWVRYRITQGRINTGVYLGPEVNILLGLSDVSSYTLYPAHYSSRENQFKYWPLFAGIRSGINLEFPVSKTMQMIFADINIGYSSILNAGPGLTMQSVNFSFGKMF